VADRHVNKGEPKLCPKRKKAFSSLAPRLV
jgi:hypothetical protein